MKNILMIIFSGAIGWASGQDSLTIAENRFLSAEVALVPFSSNPISLPYIRIRGFIRNKHAIRFGFAVSGRSDKNDDTQSKVFSYSIRPGYEFHLKGTQWLSPYIGAEFDFARRTSSYSEISPIVQTTGVSNINGDEQAFSRMGLGLLTGVDIYLIKKLYIGLELGFSMSKTTFDEISITQGSSTIILPEATSTTYGPTISRAIRLGFFFSR